VRGGFAGHDERVQLGQGVIRLRGQHGWRQGGVGDVPGPQHVAQRGARQHAGCRHMQRGSAAQRHQHLEDACIEAE
jgi:hypothetical protein